jgi:hypothetical protein
VSLSHRLFKPHWRCRKQSEIFASPARCIAYTAQARFARYMTGNGIRHEDIAGEVRRRRRGGTVLQPGVDLLERADDFPDTGPLLIITGGACDVLRVRRERAFLLPAGRSLPFIPRGPVFRIR